MNFLVKGKQSLTYRLSSSDHESLRRIKLQTCTAVVDALEDRCTGPAKHEVTELLKHYSLIKDRLSKPFSPRRSNNEGDDSVKRDLQWIAIQAERDEVQALYESGDITREIANALRRDIRDREASILEQEQQ